MGFRSENTRSRGFGQGRSGGRSGGYSRGGFGAGRGGFRDRDSGGFGERRRTEMHDVICDKCGKECQVPFKPTGDKPVLCSDCFRKGGDSGSSPRRDFGSRPGSSSGSGISKEQFNELNTKLDKILGILEMIEFEDEEGLEEESDEEAPEDVKKD